MNNKIVKYSIVTVTVLVLLFLVLDSVLINWNGSDAYDADNEEEHDNIRVAAVGDSITYGSGLSPEDTYPRTLEALLGEDYWVQNFGVRSHTAMKSADLPYVNSAEYQESLRFAPDITLIMLGSNDSKNTNWKGPGQFKAEFESLIDSYVDINPNTKIYLMTPPKAFNTPESKGQIDNNNVEEIVQVVKDLAEERAYELIDINQLTQGNSQWFEADSIHPDKAGAHSIAEEAYHHITR